MIIINMFVRFNRKHRCELGDFKLSHDFLDIAKKKNKKRKNVMIQRVRKPIKIFYVYESKWNVIKNLFQFNEKKKIENFEIDLYV